MTANDNKYTAKLTFDLMTTTSDKNYRIMRLLASPHSPTGWSNSVQKIAAPSKWVAA